MTGLIDSEVKPVDSVSKDEGLNLLEPASMSEYIKKQLYRSEGQFVQKFLALRRIEVGQRNYVSKWLTAFSDRSAWENFKYVIIGIIKFLLVGAVGVSIFSAWAYISAFAQKHLPDAVSTGVTQFGSLVFVLVASLRYLPILPLSPKALETKFSLWSRNILMDEANPKWINSQLFTAWPLLNDTDSSDPTVHSTHRDIKIDAKDFGSDNSIWHSIDSYCYKFLVKWSSVNSKERVPMILWAFNPPSSESGLWGDLREQNIDYAQRQFTKQIRGLIEGMDNLTVRDKTLEEWGQSNYSFGWLESKMKDQTPRNNVLVKTLIKWNSM